jgi:hypothetical protein
MQSGDRLLPLPQLKPRAAQGQLTGCQFGCAAKQRLQRFDRCQGVGRCNQRVGQFHGGIRIAGIEEQGFAEMVYRLRVMAGAGMDARQRPVGHRIVRPAGQ